MQVARAVAVEDLEYEARLFVGIEALDAVLSEIPHDVAVLEADCDEVIFCHQYTKRDGGVDEVLAIHLDGGDVD